MIRPGDEAKAIAMLQAPGDASRWFVALPVLLTIDDDLVRAVEDAFHGLEIHALAGDVRRLAIFLVDLREAARLTVGFCDDALAIGLGFLERLHGPSATAPGAAPAADAAVRVSG